MSGCDCVDEKEEADEEEGVVGQGKGEGRREA